MKPEPQADLIFYRACYGEPDGTLVSPRGDHRWTVGINRAVCQFGHRPPAAKCSCGLWGLTSPEGAAEYWSHELSEPVGDQPIVLLEAAGYGVAQVGRDGCRVEAAEIRAILDVRQGIDLSPWADRYEVPIVMSGLDLAVTVEGTVEAFNIPVDVPAHVGMKIGDRVLNVPTFSRLVFELWRVPVGVRIRVVRDLTNDARPIVAWRGLP